MRDIILEAYYTLIFCSYDMNLYQQSTDARVRTHTHKHKSLAHSSSKVCVCVCISTYKQVKAQISSVILPVCFPYRLSDRAGMARGVIPVTVLGTGPNSDTFN